MLGSALVGRVTAVVGHVSVEKDDVTLTDEVLSFVRVALLTMTNWVSNRKHDDNNVFPYHNDIHTSIFFHRSFRDTVYLQFNPTNPGLHSVITENEN